MDRHEVWRQDEVTVEFLEFLKEDQDKARAEAMSPSYQHPNPSQVMALNLEYCRGRFDMAQAAIDWRKEEVEDD